MSSLIVNGVNVDLEMDTAKLRQLLAEVDGGDRERIENRLRILESGTSEPERSSSTSSVPRPRPLTKTLSIGGVQLGASDVGDVTEERFSFNRSQISRAWASSSSKSLDMSNLMSVVGSEGCGTYPYQQNFKAPFYKPSRANFEQQKQQSFCESKRLISFEEHKDQLRQYQQQPHPFFNINAENVVKAETGNNHVSPHLQNQSQTIQKSQVEQSNTQSQQSTMMQSSSSTSSSVKSTCSSSSSSVGGGLNKFKQMDQQAKANSGGASLFKLNPGLKTSANNAKDIILYWCQCRIRDYENVKIENFSSSWSDGLAFCALIHHFFPDAFDYKSLDPRNRRHNFDLAFRVADEKAGIYPLLDTEDMIIMGRRPDWKCVFTYVQSLYRGLKDLS